MLITYNIALVAWFSRKQVLVAMYTAEAEYISVKAAIQTMTTLHKIMVHRNLWVTI